VNYFVTFGDMIMPDPASLYALYYEIVRSGIDPFSDLAKECMSSKANMSTRTLVLLVDFGGVSSPTHYIFLHPN
jgi:hypothetical protein